MRNLKTSSSAQAGGALRVPETRELCARPRSAGITGEESTRGESSQSQRRTETVTVPQTGPEPGPGPGPESGLRPGPGPDPSGFH